MSLWYWSRSVPLLKSFSGEDYLFYAKVHYARQSNTMGRFVLKTNADNNAEYILWLNKKNKKYVESWLNPNLPVEINAKRVGKYRWVITSMHSPISNLHFEDLLPYRRAMTLTFTAISLFLLVFLITTAQEYVLWHRHRPWFKLSQDQDKSS
ncbi:MAG: hypothetical protein GX801_00730 [Fibrobacter sp.]|nr:hypothetical protein [Fibrobacter sp.]